MSKPANKWWVNILILGSVLAIGYIFSKILIYITISVLIGALGQPVIRVLGKIRLGKRSLPSWLTSVLTLVIFIGIIGGILGLFVPLVTQEIELISSIDIDKTTALLQGRLHVLSGWIDHFGLKFDSKTLYEFTIAQTKGLVDFSGLSIVFSNIFSFISEAVTAIFSILFMSFFFLKDKSLFYKIVLTLTPVNQVERVKSIMSTSHTMLGRYIGGILIEVMIVITLSAVGLSILGVKNALLIGLFAGIFNIIPYLGPMIALGFGLLVGITTGLAMDPEILIWPVALKITGVSLVSQFLDNWFVQPLVVGNSVNTHPLEVFIVLLAAGTVGGMIGLILALPVYTLMRIVAREFLGDFSVVERLTRSLEKK